MPRRGDWPVEHAGPCRNGSHFADGHRYTADGTYVESYCLDGDGEDAAVVTYQWEGG